MTAYETGGSFTITETTAPERIITLAGRALPYRPFTLTGNQRVEVSWYPGNPIGSATVLGSGLDDTTINGWWKEIFLGDTTGPAPFQLNNSPLLTTRDAARAIENFRKGGQLLAVRWDTIIRRGFLKNFEQSWHNNRDLEWKITFAWVDEGEAAGPAVTPSTNSISDAFSAFQNIQYRMEEASFPTFPLSDTFGLELLNLLGSIYSTIGTLQGLLTNLARHSTTPRDAARRTVAVAGALAAAAKQLVALLASQPPMAMWSSTTPGMLRFGQTLRAALFATTLNDLARDLMREAVRRQVELAAQIQSELLAQYVMREGEDLRDVSRQFYNTPFEWRRLMTYNGLRGAETYPGQLVLVPRPAAL